MSVNTGFPLLGSSNKKPELRAVLFVFFWQEARTKTVSVLLLLHNCIQWVYGQGTIALPIKALAFHLVFQTRFSSQALMKQEREVGTAKGRTLTAAQRDLVEWYWCVSLVGKASV